MFCLSKLLQLLINLFFSKNSLGWKPVITVTRNKWKANVSDALSTTHGVSDIVYSCNLTGSPDVYELVYCEKTNFGHHVAISVLNHDIVTGLKNKSSPSLIFKSSSRKELLVSKQESLHICCCSSSAKLSLPMKLGSSWPHCVTSCGTDREGQD